MVKYNNHFVFAYSGNKRNEMIEINKDINLENVETIIEPFCGSGAFSFYTARDSSKKYKYILNDANKNLIELFEICKDPCKLKDFERIVNDIAEGLDKEKYNMIKSKEDVVSYYIANKVYKRVVGLFPNDYKYKYIDMHKCPFVDFIRNEQVSLSSVNGTVLLDEYKNDKTAFIFCDPPYLMSNNGFYDKSDDNIYENIYENVYHNNVNEYKCKILFCLESNWLVDLLFSKFKNKRTFDKKYTGLIKRVCKFTNITNY